MSQRPDPPRANSDNFVPVEFLMIMEHEETSINHKFSVVYKQR